MVSLYLHGALAFQQPSPARFEGTITKSVALNYLVGLPEGYDPRAAKRWPLLVFLHGSGERGDDVRRVAVHGPLKEIGRGGKLPFVIIAPQLPGNQWGWDSDVLLALIKDVERRYRIDRDREYLTGLSMGGFGTWDLATRDPGRWAAIAPICGGGDPSRAGALRNTPTWVVHGTRDQAVPIAQSQRMVDALRAAGGKPIFTVVEGGEHDVWTDVYADPRFYRWLLEHRRP